MKLSELQEEIEYIRPGSLWQLNSGRAAMCAYKVARVKGPLNSELDFYAFEGYVAINSKETLLCLGVEKLWINSAHTLCNLKMDDALFGLLYNYEKTPMIKALAQEEIVYISYTNYEHYWKTNQYMVEITGNNLV